MALDKPLIIGTKEHLHIVLPLKDFDQFKDELLGALNAPGSIEDNMLPDLRERFADVLRHQVEDLGLELFKSLIDRWDAEEDV